MIDVARFVLPVVSALTFVSSVACSEEDRSTSDASSPGVPHDDEDRDAGASVDAAEMNVTEFTCASQASVEGTCKPAASGTFAVKVAVDVWWREQLLNPGRGEIVTYLRGDIDELCEDGSGARVHIRVCGIELPTFTSEIACSSFKLDFSELDWDAPTMPSFTTVGSASGFEPGDMLATQASTGLLGVDLDDLLGPWPVGSDPAAFVCQHGQAGDSCFPDHDGDGRPGISARMARLGEVDEVAGECAPGVPYKFGGLPLDPSPASLVPDGPRAQTIALGLRTRLGTSAVIADDCEHGSGDASSGQMDSFTYACWTGDGTECLPSEASFLNDSSPTWVVLGKGEAPPSDLDGVDHRTSDGPRAFLVRLGDRDESFDCEDVRNADFEQP